MIGPAQTPTTQSPACLCHPRLQPVSRSPRFRKHQVAAAMFRLHTPIPARTVPATGCSSEHRSCLSMVLVRPARQACRAAAAASSGEEVDGPASQSDNQKSNALFWSLALVITGTLNRIFYKMALKPMSNYVIFLAQFQTLVYTAVYGSVLLFKYRAGRVTKREITGNDTRFFLGIGFFEATALVMGFLGAALLPGVVLPLLQQSYLLWQILVNRVLLGKSLLRVEALGATMVGLGVCYAAWPSRSGSSAFSQANPAGVALFTVSLFLLVFDTLAKEHVFDTAKQRNGRPLDVFVVNSFGSAAQAGFVALLLPVLAFFRGIPPARLPDYLLQGSRALRGLTPSCGTDCSMAPKLVPLYIAMNLAYNISLLALLRSAGNVSMSLASSVLIPLTIWAFTWPWPFLDPSPALGVNFFTGASVMLLGLFVFNAPLWRPLLPARKSGATSSSPKAA